MAIVAQDEVEPVVHKVVMWTLERADDDVSVILTFGTPGNFEVSFVVPEDDLNSMAEAVANVAERDLEAYPDRLRPH